MTDAAVETVSTRQRWNTATTWAFVVVAISILVPAQPGAQLISVVGLVLLPGMVVTSLVIGVGLTGIRKLLVSAGVGITVFCLVGAVAGGLGPLIGVERPLSRVPLLLLWLVILGSFCVVAINRRLDPVREILSAVPRRAYYWAFAVALAPCVALIGATSLNATGANGVAILATVLGLGLIFSSVTLSSRVGESIQTALLASGVVTLVWQLPTRGGWLWGWDIQQEFSVASATVTSGRFPIPHNHDPYAGMLSLTVLPAQLHFLNGMQLRTIFVLLPGVLLAGCAATTLVTVRRIAGPAWSSFLVALLIVGTASFLSELPALMRQCVALFLFTLVIQLVAHPPNPVRRTRLLVVIIGIGLAVSHYSTAYLAAGAALTGWLLGLALRSDRSRRVLTAWVAWGIAAAAAIWGLVIADTGSYLRQVADAIRRSGLDLLPGSGNVLTRWIEGTAAGKTGSATAIRAADMAARLTRYDWMQVDPRANAVRLESVASHGSKGVPILGTIVQNGATAAREVILLFIVVAVLWAVWRMFKRREHIEIVGLAVFGGIASAVSRTSGTLSLQFNTDRVEAQMYLIFVVLGAYLVHEWRVRIPRVAPWILGALGTAQVALAFGVGGYAVPNSSLPVALDANGYELQQLAVTPADRDAAHWLIATSGARTIQADPYSSLALDDFGGAYRKNFVETVDPVIVDNSAWVLATTTNVTDHTARATIGDLSGSFVFPSRYFGRTRSVLYASRSDVVYGSDPS